MKITRAYSCERHSKPFLANKQVSLLIGVVAIIFFTAANANAATWYADTVGGGYGTSASAPALPQYAINTASSGDTIVLAAGTYNLGSSYGMGLTATRKDLTFIGAGVGSTIIDLTNESVIFNESNSSVSHMTFQNGTARKVIVTNGSDMEFNQTEFVSFSTTALYLKYSYAYVHDSFFDTNTTGVGVTHHSEADVENCHFFNSTDEGVYLAQTLSSSVSNCRFNSNKIGVRMSANSRDSGAEISDNVFFGNQWGVSLSDMGYHCEAIVTRNMFDANTVVGMHTTADTDAAHIRANHFRGNSIAVYLGGTADVVVNNLIHHNTSHGIWSSGGDSIIAFNTIDQNQGDGILTDNGDTSLVANNTSTENLGAGIRAVASWLTDVGSNNSMYNGIDYAGTFTSWGGNTSLNPQYVGGNDYSLLPSSPLIGAANGSLHQVSVDFWGTTRLPTPSDIGAFEY